MSNYQGNFMRVANARTRAAKARARYRQAVFDSADTSGVLALADAALAPAPRFELGDPMARPERKVVDNIFGVFGNNPYGVINNTNPVLLVNWVQQGTDFTNRIGRQITMDAIQIRGSISMQNTLGNNWNSTMTYPASFIRLMLVYDYQPTATLPTIDDILYSNVAGGYGPPAGVFTEYSHMNLGNRARFKVIWDKSICTPMYTQSFGASYNNLTSMWEKNLLLQQNVLEPIDIDEYIPCNYKANFKTTGTQTGGEPNVSDFELGAIYLVKHINNPNGAYTSDGSAQDNLFYFFDNVIRIRFVDN